VLDQYGGGLDTNNPMARATIGLRNSQAGEAGARAGLARAQADDARAGKFDAGSGTVIDVRTGTRRRSSTSPPASRSAARPRRPEPGAGERAGLRVADAGREQGAGVAGGQGRHAAGQHLLGRERAAHGIGGIAGDLANGTQSDDQQQVDQAQRNFINATLRRESGASISPGEFENARKQYFPQPGDKPGVLAQKAANRQRVIQSMFAAVPPNMRELPPLPGTADAPAGKPIAVDY
jgi:hypothetical protein